MSDIVKSKVSETPGAGELVKRFFEEEAEGYLQKVFAGKTKKCGR